MVEDDEIILKDAPSDLGAAMDNLDNPLHLSKNTRLTETTESCIMIIDSICGAGIWPPIVQQLVKNKKELAISKDGLGRQEKVALTQSERELQSGNRISNAFSNLFKKSD